MHSAPAGACLSTEDLHSAEAGGSSTSGIRGVASSAVAPAPSSAEAEGVDTISIATSDWAVEGSVVVALSVAAPYLATPPLAHLPRWRSDDSGEALEPDSGEAFEPDAARYTCR